MESVVLFFCSHKGLADLAVLDQNPLEIDPQQILEIQVVMTIVHGNIVFQDAE